MASKTSTSVSAFVKSSVATLMICSSIAAMAKEKTHIIVRAAEGVAPTELAISKSKEDSAKSPYKTKLENGIYELDIETDFIEQYEITDLSQMINNSQKFPSGVLKWAFLPHFNTPDDLKNSITADFMVDLKLICSLSR